jgi:putative tricarboxylic transport membrane protein
MRFSDAVIGAVLIGLAIMTALATRSFPEMPGQNYGPALFPRLLSAGLATSGVLLMLSGLRERATQPLVALDDWARSARGLGTLAITLAVLVFYVLASEPLGFLPTAFITVSAVMVRLRGRWPSSVLIAAATTLLVHRIFYGLLLVPLPWGVLEPLVF